MKKRSHIQRTWSKDLPDPASPEAKRRGCTCDNWTNNNGRGWRRKGERARRWDPAENCPLHGGARVLDGGELDPTTMD